MAIKVPSREQHAERERVYTRLRRGASQFGGARFSKAECQTLCEIFDTLIEDVMMSRARPERPDERNSEMPTVCGHCGRVDCLGTCQGKIQ